MSREDAIRVDGTVVEVLPNTMFRVALPNGHEILAHVSGKVRLENSGILTGDKVVVQMTPYDLSIGCITYRQK